MIQLLTKESLKGQLETILRGFLIGKTRHNLVLKENEDNNDVGYPRVEFEVIEINPNQESMTIHSENDDEGQNIIDNYNRTARYMFDFVFIHKSDDESNIDGLLNIITNKWKLDRYFYNLDYKDYDIQDITINQDFKAENRNMFYLDQSIKIDGYSFTFDVEINDKDVIAMGVTMRRGEIND
ncbi:hypothetical protein [Cetobacterium sp.]|uniref:hypothetical protein n=1 Tax=Cetobacterium sp. TaxID=2071632 RepID=UPI003F66FCE5